MSETVAGAEYVVGFMFDRSEEHCLLIRKTRPWWQVGKLNGVGGRIESGESSLAAMRREFLEETGVDCNEWQLFCVLGDERQWLIHFFWATGPIDKASRLTDETPEAVITSALPSDVIPNLKWLIPMALSMKHERIDYFDVKERMK